MIQVVLEIDGAPVGAGRFEVLPRIGESVCVIVRFPGESRDITGRVGDVRHGSRVWMEAGELRSVATVTVCLVDAKVETPCTETSSSQT